MLQVVTWVTIWNVAHAGTPKKIPVGANCPNVTQCDCHLYHTCVAAKIIVLFVILPDLTLDYYIDLITVDF